MNAYYYLIASLPMLLPDTPPPLDYDIFLELCEGVVTESTYAALRTINSNTRYKEPLLSEWNSFYNKLQAELSYGRSQLRGKTGVLPEDREFSSLVQAALSAANPLEAELILLKAQFEKIDSLVGLHAFDTSFLFGYAVKLKLLERQYGFRFTEGKQEFLSLLDDIRQEIYSL